MVDACGRFTYVNAGGAGQIEDASVWNRSALRALIEDGTWLAVPENVTSKRMTLDGMVLRPYICAESAFAPSPTLMKCYVTVTSTREQFNFNYALTCKARC